MKAHIPTANPVITIPEEIKNSSKQIKFSYLAMRNLIYAYRINIKDSSAAENFAISLTNNFGLICEEHNIKMFKNDEERDNLFKLICSFDRNILNRNEHIIMLYRQLRPHKGTTKEQLLTLYCQVMLECAFQMENGILTASIIESVYDELMKKMLIQSNDTMRKFFVNDIVDTFNKL